MKVEHTLEVKALCPVDRLPDVYIMTVRTTGIVKVEDILYVVAGLATEPMFQEEVTQHIHRALGCQVQTIGYHSGVRTLVVCG